MNNFNPDKSIFPLPNNAICQGCFNHFDPSKNSCSFRDGNWFCCPCSAIYIKTHEAEEHKKDLDELRQRRKEALDKDPLSKSRRLSQELEREERIEDMVKAIRQVLSQLINF